MKKSTGRHSGKFTPLDTADIMHERVLLPGRIVCNCEATRHELIHNCLECGRIVCAQEGSGPCFTCGNLVCTPSEQEVILRNSKASQKLYIKLMNLNGDKQSSSIPNTNDGKLQNALEHRDKLLEYDRNIEKRTKVIDDENDYFQVDSKWLSAKERKILAKKKEEVDDLMTNRRKQMFSFDFAGRKIIEETPSIQIDPDELLKTDASIFDSQDYTSTDIPQDFKPTYEDNEEISYQYVSDPKEEKRLNIRIQDKEIQQMSDEGNCLSLHQPYASLLVAGIKTHEGRVWYTSYRGRLWIHAAGKVASKQEIAELENLYKNIRSNCTFPKSYPSGCLLGCVDLVDCLPQEEYKAMYPSGEIATAYVFICENAQQLSIKFPMKGKHKIFKLESNIHQAAKKTLSKSMH